MMPRFENDGVELNYTDQGQGVPFVFQHGLGATASQPLEVMPEDTRNITLEFRGHGKSATGPAAALSIRTFADDLSALIDDLKLDRPLLGGISMGAAISLRLAVQRPDSIRGLILARPAWLLDSMPPNMNIFASAARFMKDPVNGIRKFQDSREFAELSDCSPDNAASVLGQFQADDLSSRQSLLAAISQDGPGVVQDQLKLLERVPVLVVGNDEDAIHPLPMAKALAELIPEAEFVQITAKSTSKERYFSEFRKVVKRFVSSTPS